MFTAEEQEYLQAPLERLRELLSYELNNARWVRAERAAGRVPDPFAVHSERRASLLVAVIRRRTVG